jgi:hypothetical protein
MRLRFAVLALFCSAAAAAQGDAKAEVRAALEEQAPVPSRPLVLPQPMVPNLKRANPAEVRRGAAESARMRAEEQAGRSRGKSLDHIPAAANGAQGTLGQAGQSAAGQARAEEVRKNNRGGKPPKPPKP